MARIKVVNMTTFFNRELLMYSLGDIKFRKPIALKKVAYVTMFLVIWALPWFIVLGFPTGPFSFFWVFVIPVIAGHIASKPVFGGKGLIDYIQTLFGKMGEPRGWTDLNSNNALEDEVLSIEHEIWISRRRELDLLANNLLDGVEVREQ